MKQAFDNLNRIQHDLENNNNAEKEIRLPILEQTSSGFYPATTKDMALIRQAIIARAIKTLPTEGIYIRDKSLYDLNNNDYLEKIPNDIYRELFASHEVRWEIFEQEEKPGKNGLIKITNVKRFLDETIDISLLISDVENDAITKTIIKNNLIPELFWLNEKSGFNAFIPGFPTFAEFILQSMNTLFINWMAWMRENASEQFDFFEMILQDYLYANQIRSAERKLCAGIGPNASGKGSLIKMLQCIPNTRPPTEFPKTALEHEFRSDEAFKVNASITVCHEFPFNTKVKSDTIGVIKSALRGEKLNVRSVGSTAKTIRYFGGIVFFTNSNQDKVQALTQAHRYYAEWLAYDRFNIVFIDWLKRCPYSKRIINTIDNENSLEARALGLCIFYHAESIKGKTIPYHPIPDNVKAEGRGEKISRADELLEAMLEIWRETLAEIRSLAFEDQLPARERQQEIARINFGHLLRDKNLLAKEFSHFEKTDAGELIQTCFASETMNFLMGRLGSSRKWAVPPHYSDRIDKSVCVGKERFRVTMFRSV